MSLEDFIGVIRNVVQQKRDTNQPPAIVPPSIVPSISITSCTVPAPVTSVPAVTPLTSQGLRVFHVYMCLFVVGSLFVGFFGFLFVLLCPVIYCSVVAHVGGVGPYHLL